MKKLLFAVFVAILLLAGGCRDGISAGGYFSNAKAMVQEVKPDISEITGEELKAKLEQGTLRLLIDVREAEEFNEGYIGQPDAEEFNEGYIGQPDAEGEYPYAETFTVNVPRGILEFKISSKDYWDNELWVDMPAREEEIVLYCGTGDRSALAAFALQQLGYQKIRSLQGGYKKWLNPQAAEEEVQRSSGGCG